MNVVLAPDSFKGSLLASESCAHIEAVFLVENRLIYALFIFIKQCSK
jgi:glycerate kinase